MPPPPPLFDPGVPVEQLPWGVEGSRPVASRTCTYHHGDVALEGYMAWDADALSGGGGGGGGGGLPGILVAHTAIGPQEVFVHSCCDALARAGYFAFALDLFGTGECVFDKQIRDGILVPLRENRDEYAARVHASYEALCAQPEVDEKNRGVAAIGSGAVFHLYCIHSLRVDTTVFVISSSSGCSPAVQQKINHGSRSRMR